MKRNWFIFLLLSLVPALLRADQPAAAASNSTPVSLNSADVKWTQNFNENGFTTYWASIPGSQVIALRGEGIVNADMEKVASIIIDTTRGAEWINSLVASKVVRSISNTEFIEYDHVGIPFPFDQVISDRDFVTHVTVHYDAKTGWMTVHYKPVTDEGAPVIKKYTRGLLECEFRIVRMSIHSQTYVEARVFSDPKGSIPKWLVNFFQESWPHDTFEGLRNQAKKTDIGVLPVVSELMGKGAKEKMVARNP
jgi:hypothetical protein